MSEPFDPIKSLEKHLGEFDFNSRIPFYNDSSDYTTNAPSYYDDLARKNKLIKHLALRIWNYDKELQKRFEAWDKNLEEFDDEVLRLLQEWMKDGTFDRIISDMFYGRHNLKSWGSISDRETDNTSIVQTALNELEPYSILVIPVGTKWDYNEINHPEDIVIYDESMWDFTYKMWTTQQKVFTNASDPGTRNANEIVHSSPYHAAYVLDVTGENTRTSLIFRRSGEGRFQLMSEEYNDDNLFSLKDLQPSIATNLLQFLGGKNARNEIGINIVPSKGVTFQRRSRVDGDSIIREYSSDEENGIVYQMYKGLQETHRIKFEPDTGDILITNMDSGKFVKILKEGYVQEATESIQGSPRGNLEIYKFGQLAYDNQSSTWYISASNNGTNGWQALQPRNRSVIQGTPIGNVDINFLGEEVFDSTNQIWYKSASNSGNLGWIALNN